MKITLKKTAATLAALSALLLLPSCVTTAQAEKMAQKKFHSGYVAGGHDTATEIAEEAEKAALYGRLSGLEEASQAQGETVKGLQGVSLQQGSAVKRIERDVQQHGDDLGAVAATVIGVVAHNQTAKAMEETQEAEDASTYTMEGQRIISTLNAKTAAAAARYDASVPVNAGEVQE